MRGRVAMRLFGEGAMFFGGRKGKGGYSVIRLFSHPLVMYKSVSEVISPTA